MIKKFNIYLENKNNNSLKNISEDFWKMTEIADWQDFINNMKKPGAKYNDELEKVRGRIYKNFELYDINDFYLQCSDLYDFLKNKFKNIIKELNISNDSYDDLISSIIGLGKNYVENALKDINFIKKMVSDDNYYENFRYILTVSKTNYHEIRCKYDPIYRDMLKYNL